ncbi:MAG TPA: 30S ribosomal protein S20 [Candidatus Saccharimonadia bacterium]|nr:30S ribosomal protein S20 [Candidatus Saccharimonadia bacterium]
MPIIKSAMKRAKQSLVHRHRNLHVKRAVKQDINALHAALETRDAKEIQEKLNAAYSEIDRAVKKHTLHKNTAARRKSVLAHEVAKAAGVEAVPAETKTTKGAGKKAVTAKTAAKKAPASKAVAAKKPAAKKTAAPKAAVKKTDTVKKTKAESDK